MIFCHIVDDYYLQGILASMKQQGWWKLNAPDPLYAYDYKMALLMHSFSWTVSIMLIPTAYVIFNGLYWDPFLFIGNFLIHIKVDDLKANQKKINLIQDQTIHLIQICLTWICMIF